MYHFIIFICSLPCVFIIQNLVSFPHCPLFTHLPSSICLHSPFPLVITTLLSVSLGYSVAFVCFVCSLLSHKRSLLLSKTEVKEAVTLVASKPLFLSLFSFSASWATIHPPLISKLEKTPSHEEGFSPGEFWNFSETTE